MPGSASALCERCMPRLDGDFLFCWTAMAAPDLQGWWKTRPAHRDTQAGLRAKPATIAPNPNTRFGARGSRFAALPADCSCHRLWVPLVTFQTRRCISIDTGANMTTALLTMAVAVLASALSAACGGGTQAPPGSAPVAEATPGTAPVAEVPPSAPAASVKRFPLEEGKPAGG